MTVGALEPQFYRALLAGLGITETAPDREDPAQRDSLRQLLTEKFKERTQQEWCEVFDGTDACCWPVLPLTEAARHPHLVHRGTYVEHCGVLSPAPAPRFSVTPATLSSGPSIPGGQTVAALQAWGIQDVAGLLEAGVALRPEVS